MHSGSSVTLKLPDSSNYQCEVEEMKFRMSLCCLSVAFVGGNLSLFVINLILLDIDSALLCLLYVGMQVMLIKHLFAYEIQNLWQILKGRGRQ